MDLNGYIEHEFLIFATGGSIPLKMIDLSGLSLSLVGRVSPLHLDILTMRPTTSKAKSFDGSLNRVDFPSIFKYLI